MASLKELASLVLSQQAEQRAAVTPVSSEGEQPETEPTWSSWMLTYADGRRVQKSYTLRVTREHVLRKFPDATGAEPVSVRDAFGVPDLPGVSTEFAARLSPDDLGDIATGDIPLGTVQAYEHAAIAMEAEDLREHFEERAGILEHDGGLSKPAAEREAACITATYARNRGYLWASLRLALAGYPALLTVLLDKPGTVDALPFGVAKVAVLKGGLVVRQGAFTGAHEVKA